MHQRTLITRSTVKGAAWTLLASTALALTLIACGPGPTNDVPPPTGDVSIAVTVVGDGRATLGALDFSCSDTCTLLVDEGTDVSLAAVPNAGRVLVAWDGPCSPFEDTCAWTANEDVAVTVTFAPHALRFDLEGDGEGRFVINAAGEDTVCREACGVAIQLFLDNGVTIQYDGEGSTRTTLDPWIGCDEVDAAGTYCRVVVEGVTTVAKTWRLWPLLALHKEGGGEGRVSSDPPGIDCGIECVSSSEYYDFDTPVTLTALPAVGSTFAGWNGVDCDGGNTNTTCTFTITSNTTIGANFDRDIYTLTVNRDGNGDGTITSSPAGINLSSSQTQDSSAFPHGEEITLTADPADSSTFTGWNGVDCDGGNTNTTCTFTITSNTTMTAAFDLKTYTLDVSRTGSGIGTITSTPTGIDVTTTQAQDSATFDHGQQITLTATEGALSVFGGWSGIPCDEGDATLECSFVIQQDETVNATFDLATP